MQVLICDVVESQNGVLGELLLFSICCYSLRFRQWMIWSDVMMDEIKDCGERVDKVRLPRFYWQILRSLLFLGHFGFYGAYNSRTHLKYHCVLHISHWINI